MSRWSKKDYEMVAEHLRIGRRIIFHSDGMHLAMCAKFADTFGNDSNKFNRALFLKACGWREVTP